MKTFYLPTGSGWKEARVQEQDGSLIVSLEGKSFQIHAPLLEKYRALLILEQQPMPVVFEQNNKHWDLLLAGKFYRRAVFTAREKLQFELMEKEAGGHHGGVVKAPMPGLILRLEVEPGHSVEVGTPLLIMEAMKMENELRSPVKGVVKEIRVSAQQAVEKDDILLVIE